MELSTELSKSYHSDKRLINLLQTEMNSEEQQMVVQNFSRYLDYGDDETKFIVDLDEIWEMIGFTRKTNAKILLENNFEKGKDYIINMIEEKTASVVAEAVFQNNITDEIKKNGGQNKQKIFMNVNTFKEFCMLAKTEKSKKIRMYYVKMENILFKFIKSKSKKNMLKSKNY